MIKKFNKNYIISGLGLKRLEEALAHELMKRPFESTKLLQKIIIYKRKSNYNNKILPKACLS